MSMREGSPLVRVRTVREVPLELTLSRFEVVEDSSSALQTRVLKHRQSVRRRSVVGRICEGPSSFLSETVNATIRFHWLDVHAVRQDSTWAQQFEKGSGRLENRNFQKFL